MTESPLKSTENLDFFYNSRGGSGPFLEKWGMDFLKEGSNDFFLVFEKGEGSKTFLII